MGAQQVVAGPAPVFVGGGGVRLGADLRIEPGDPAAPVEQCQGHAGTFIMASLAGRRAGGAPCSTALGRAGGAQSNGTGGTGIRGLAPGPAEPRRRATATAPGAASCRTPASQRGAAFGPAAPA